MTELSDLLCSTQLVCVSLTQIDAKELEKERRIEEAVKRIEQLNVSRSDSPEVGGVFALIVESNIGDKEVLASVTVARHFARQVTPDHLQPNAYIKYEVTFTIICVMSV